MASRTYLPHLKFIIVIVCKYMQRYEQAIKAHLGGGSAEAAFDAVLAACVAFVPILDTLIPDPT